MENDQQLITGANIPDIVRQLIRTCTAMKEPSFTAFLPLLRFEGHPYTLKFHFQLEPLYRMLMPRRMVLMTGRQVGKSQGLVSSTILKCALTPNYHTLICEPQFMQIRQISNITFRNMVAQSYIANYMIGPNCNNSMLIREFTSGSRANFMYIGGGADRARGLAGIKRLTLDESVRWDTKVLTCDTDGNLSCKYIKDVKEKDFIVSFAFSDSPRILISVVKRNASFHGHRACFKVTTEAGREIICTADHAFPTSHGAKRLEEIIENEHTRRTGKNREHHTYTTERLDGESIGGCESAAQLETVSTHTLESRCEAGRLRECEVRPLVRARDEATVQATESRLRGYLVCFDAEEPWDVSLIVSDVVPGWHETKEDNRRIPDAHNTPDCVGLVMDGRRKSLERSQLRNTEHECLSEGGCGNTTEMVKYSVGSRDTHGRGFSYPIGETFVGTEHSSTNICKAYWLDKPLHSRCDAVQDSPRNEDLPGMREGLPQGTQTAMLLGRVPETVQEGAESHILQGTSGGAQGTESCLARGEQGAGASAEEGVERQHDGGAEGAQTREEPRENAGTHGRPRGTREDPCPAESASSGAPADRRVPCEETRGGSTLSRASKGGSGTLGGLSAEAQREEPSETEGASCELITGIPSTFSYDRIAKVEYVGEDDVYDIEVEGTHSFILANGLLSFNCDDMEVDVINIVAETMSAVKEGGTYLFTGTPKLTDGTLPYYYNKSSGGEITIKCEHCNKVNIASIEYDLLKMIGKTTCVCAKCGKPLDVRKSYYSFRRPELRASFDGFHLSQVTHPLHCTSLVKWRELLNKLETYPKAQAYNELLGEPCDEAIRLITRRDLEEATTGVENSYENAMRLKKNYAQRVLGIDWGGYGLEGESFTVMAVLGIRPMENIIEVIYIEKIPTGRTHAEQVGRAVSLAEQFDCVVVAHDGTGAGAIKEEMLTQEMSVDGAGIMTVPMVYMWAPRQDTLRYNEPNNGHAGFYSLDKTRSLALTLAAIKAKKLLLPKFSSCQGLLEDFLALGEDVRSTQNSGDIRIITRMGTHPDDTAHAVNLGANAIWYINKCRPDLGSMVSKYDNQPDWVGGGNNLKI